MLKINRSLTLEPFVVFHAFDGKDYPGTVTRVSRGIATVIYRVSFGPPYAEKITAYVSDPARLSPRSVA